MNAAHAIIGITLALSLNRTFGNVTNLISAADAEIHQNSPDFNFGTGTSMVSGTLGSNSRMEIRHALLRFDLSGAIPAGSVINSVTLRLVVTKIPFGAISSTFALHRLLQPWDEATVTWNSSTSTTAWNQPGATGTSDSAAIVSSEVFVSGNGPYTFSSKPTLVADVQAWVNSPSSSFGWLLLTESPTIAKSARHFGANIDPNRTCRWNI